MTSPRASRRPAAAADPAAGEPLGWAPSPLPAGDGETAGDGLWLLFADPVGLGAQIARDLAAAGVTAVTVTPGAARERTGERSWTLPPADRDGYPALLADLGEVPAVVLHLWGLGGEPAGGPGGPGGPSADLFAGLEQGEERGLRSALYLLRALAPPVVPLRAVIAADRLQRVRRGEAADPLRAALPGLCAAVATACPGLLCRTVDLLPPAPGPPRRAWVAATARLLVAEARHGREPAVAYRGGERWEPVPGEAPETDLERALAEIWRQLLGGPPVERRESFFARGGDSRRALELAARVRDRLGVDLPLSRLLAAPTVAGLAETIEAIAAIEAAGGGEGRPAPGRGRAEEGLAPPRLPLSTAASLPGPPRRSEGATLRLEPAVWGRLRERAARRAIGPAGAVLAALCDVLATWSADPRFAVAVPGAGLVAVDAAAPGSFTERARALQERLWGALPGGVEVPAEAPAGWPVTFSFGALEAPSPPGATLACRAAEVAGGLAVDWQTALDPALAGILLAALRDHLHRLAAAGGEAAWSDERRRLIPPQQLARRVLAAGSATLSPGRLPELTELAGLTLHVLDDRLEPRPDGVPGALWIGGPGLPRAGATRHPDTGERLLKTGETARWLPDGRVEIL